MYSTPSEIRTHLVQSFRDTVENMDVDNIEEAVDRYFSKKYIQHTDGHTLDYAGFIEHMKALKALLQSAHTTFEHIVVEGHTLCSVHLVEARKKDGSEIVARVFAYYELDHEGKFVYVDECTQILKGSKEDADIGSRR